MREMKRSYFRNRKAEKLSVYQEDEIWAKRERKEMLKEMIEKILGSILNLTYIIVVSVASSLLTTLVLKLMRG